MSAFESYRALGGSWDLVVVGVAMWSDDLPALSAELRTHVHFAGRLNNADLVRAVAGAEGLVFVPWFEGFGIPVVEAMACGVPVISSNVTSLPEVCGDAAFALVDPAQPQAIAHEMHRLELDSEAAQSASQRGLARAKTYSWAATGAKLDKALNTMLT